MAKLNPNMKSQALAFIESKFRRTQYFDYAYAAAKKLKGTKLASYIFRLFMKDRNKWDKHEEGPPDCHRGCSYCCHLKVDVEKCEGLYLARHIKKNYTKDQIKRLKKAAQERVVLTEGKDAAWFPGQKLPCILLNVNTGDCMAYDGRPLACRRTYSYNKEMCRTGYEGTTDGNWWWAAPFLISEDIMGGMAYAMLEEDRYEEMTLDEALTKYL